MLDVVDSKGDPTSFIDKLGHDVSLATSILSSSLGDI